MAEAKQMTRAMLILVAILAACTYPPSRTEIDIPTLVIPAPSVEVVEVAAPKKEPPKPARKAAAKAPAIEQPEQKNPLEECKNIEAETPKAAARAKMDCITEKLKIE